MRVVFEAKYREDGTMLVTSPSIPLFCAVANHGDWGFVLSLAAEMVALNGGDSVEPEQHYREWKS